MQAWMYRCQACILHTTSTALCMYTCADKKVLCMYVCVCVCSLGFASNASNFGLCQNQVKVPFTLGRGEGRNEMDKLKQFNFPEV